MLPEWACSWHGCDQAQSGGGVVGAGFGAAVERAVGAPVVQAARPSRARVLHLAAEAGVIAGTGEASAGFFFVFRSLLSGTKRGRALGNIAAVLGIFSAIGFVGVGFTPCNLWPYMHWICANVSFRILLLAVAVDSVALGLDRDTPRRCLWIFAGFGLLLAGYILLLQFGPSMSTPTGRVVQVASQKVIIYSSILSIGVQTLIADRLVRQSRVSVVA